MVAQFWIASRLILLTCLLLSIAMLVGRYLRDMRACIRQLHSLNSQVMETPLGPTEYARIGKGHPLLVVHGALGGFDQGLFLAQRAGLNVPGIQIISVSRSGHLRSSVPAGATLNSQADAYACLLDALDIQQAAVLAVSAGATSAIRFAVRHPDRVSALILMCPEVPGMLLPPKFLFNTLLRSDFVYWLLITFFGKTMEVPTGLVPRGFARTAEYQVVIQTFLRTNIPMSRKMDGFIFETYTVAPELTASLLATSPYPVSRIRAPVLILDTQDDPITILDSVSALAGQMPNARLHILPDGGHFFFGHMEEVRSEIAQFLRESVTQLQMDTLVPGGGRSYA